MADSSSGTSTGGGGVSNVSSTQYWNLLEDPTNSCWVLTLSSVVVPLARFASLLRSANPLNIPVTGALTPPNTSSASMMGVLNGAGWRGSSCSCSSNKRFMSNSKPVGGACCSSWPMALGEVGKAGRSCQGVEASMTSDDAFSGSSVGSTNPCAGVSCSNSPFGMASSVRSPIKRRRVSGSSRGCILAEVSRWKAGPSFDWAIRMLSTASRRMVMTEAGYPSHSSRMAVASCMVKSLSMTPTEAKRCRTRAITSPVENGVRRTSSNPSTIAAGNWCRSLTSHTRTNKALSRSREA